MKTKVSGRYFLAMILLPVAYHVGAQDLPRYQTAREGKIFKVFQFPRDQMPRIDGNTDDWLMVPDDYIYDTGQLNDTVLFFM